MEITRCQEEGRTHKKSHGCCDRIACKHNVKWNTFEENTYGSTEGASLFLQLSTMEQKKKSPLSQVKLIYFYSVNSQQTFSHHPLHVESVQTVLLNLHSHSQFTFLSKISTTEEVVLIVCMSSFLSPLLIHCPIMLRVQNILNTFKNNGLQPCLYNYCLINLKPLKL